MKKLLVIIMSICMLSGLYLPVNASNHKTANQSLDTGTIYIPTGMVYEPYLKQEDGMLENDYKFTTEYQITDETIVEEHGLAGIRALTIGETDVVFTTKNGTEYTTHVITTPGYIHNAVSKKAKMKQFVRKIPGYENGTWTSSNKNVVSINKKTGVAKFKKDGKCTLTFNLYGKKYRFKTYSYDANKWTKKLTNHILTSQNGSNIRVDGVFIGDIYQCITAKLSYYSNDMFLGGKRWNEGVLWYTRLKTSWEPMFMNLIIDYTDPN